jgi:multidrug resistance efflux pump
MNQFASRLAAFAGQRNVIKEKIAQLEAQITGRQAQVKAYKAQLQSVKKELGDIEPLVKQGLIAMPRYRQLERRVPDWRVRRPMRSRISLRRGRRSPNRCSKWLSSITIE